MNILGIDFEEWYHLELVKEFIPQEKHKPSVINGIEKILEWLQKNDTVATFFVVGELLEQKNELLDMIIENGHEIAFHTMHHNRLDSIGFKEKFLNEVNDFAKLTKHKSKGFRAPTFSLNQSSAWALDVLSDNGYVYDSSVVPTKGKMYGIPNADIKPYKISSRSLEKNDEQGKLLEFPLMVTKFFGKTIPAGGGFYLRTLPMKIIERAIESYQRKEIPGVFYIHSWELTPEHMPKISLPFKNNFITYHNLDSALPKMTKLIQKFKFTSFEKFISS